MNRYLKICLAFKADMRRALNKGKIKNNDCRNNHRYYPEQVLKAGDPLLMTLYKFWVLAGHCPVERWIYYHKDFINHTKLLLYIVKLFEVPQANYDKEKQELTFIIKL